MDNLSTIMSLSLGAAAIVSPIFVAFINNAHTKKIRIEELKHDRELKKIDSDLRLAEKRMDIEFGAKKEAFSKVLSDAGNYYLDMDNPELLAKLYSSAHEAISLCTYHECRNNVLSFINCATKKFNKSSDGNSMKSYQLALESLSAAFSYELFGESKSANDNICS